MSDYYAQRRAASRAMYPRTGSVGTPAHSPRTGSVDNVPREALRVVMQLAALQIGNRDHGPGSGVVMFERALAMVRAAYDDDGGQA
jgi:hypothetical protein